MAKRLFILGAGFSHSTGMPLANELTEPAIRRATYFDEADKESNRVYEWWKSLGKRLLGPQGRLLSIEEVFHYARFEIEAFRLYRHVRRKSDLDRRAQQWCRELQIAVIEEIWERQNACLKSDEFIALQRWAKIVEPDDVVVVFNYDQLAEKSLESVGKSWSHGFPKSDMLGIPVLKLHGSIDWLVAKCFDELHPLTKSPNCTVLWSSKFRQAKSEVADKVLATKQRTKSECLLRINCPELLDLNICPSLTFAWEEKTPGIAGLGAYKPLSEVPGLGRIWRKACLALHEVDEVIVVGFSFADFDATASLQFGGVTCLRSERGSRLQRLTIVDPGAFAVGERARSIFQPLECRLLAQPHQEIDWERI